MEEIHPIYKPINWISKIAIFNLEEEFQIYYINFFVYSIVNDFLIEFYNFINNFITTTWSHSITDKFNSIHSQGIHCLKLNIQKRKILIQLYKIWVIFRKSWDNKKWKRYIQLDKWRDQGNSLNLWYHILNHFYRYTSNQNKELIVIKFAIFVRRPINRNKKKWSW